MTFDVTEVTIWRDTDDGLVPESLRDMGQASTLGVRSLRVADATIRPGQSLIVTAENALVPEFLDRVWWPNGACDPPAAACLSAWRHRGDPYRPPAGPIDMFTATMWQASDATRRIPHAISLFETVDNHFGHGMLDHLHRLRAAESVHVSWPILVSERMPATIVQWVRRILPGHEVLRCAAQEVIHVTDLIVPLESARLWHVPSRFPASQPWPATIDPTGMKWLQQKAAHWHANVPVDRNRKLWLRRDRSPNCAIANEAEVVAVARDYGFEDTYLEELSLDGAQELLRQTSQIIAPMGSVITNLVLTDPGITVWQLTHEDLDVCRLGSMTWLNRIGHSSYVIAAGTHSQSYRISQDVAADIEGLHPLSGT